MIVAATSVVLVRRVAVAHGGMDQPTHRGRRDTPPPRAGGLGLIAVVIVGIAVLDLSAPNLAMLVGAAGRAAVAAVGWFDARRGLSRRTRLAVHVLSGVAVGMVSLQPDAPMASKIALVLWYSSNELAPC